MPYRLFLSYAHADLEYRERLETHLKHPVREGRLTTWCDREIPPGGKWDGVIRDEIRTCDAVVFLVSADLLASDYINGVEMKIARERLARGEIDVLAVPIFHSLIDQTWFAERQALWNPEMPIGGLKTRGEQEAAWVTVVRKLLEAAGAAAKARQPMLEAVAGAAPPPASLARSAARFRRAAHAPLLARGGFFGREKELDDLDAWLTGNGPHGDSRIVVLRALGGMGKSALAWRWSQTDAAGFGLQAGFEGVFWWSFYAPGFHIRAFAKAALTFLGVAANDMPTGLGPRLDLLAVLAQERAAIFILDGFERELRRYARSDAPDDARAAAAQSGASRPDACVDPETETFLGRVAAAPGMSRWLMTTRVTPEVLVDLQGAREIVLGGLSHEATRALFAEQGVSASEQALTALDARFGGHGLTLSVYARSLKRHHVTDLTQATLRAGSADALWKEATDGADEAERRLRVLMESIKALSPTAREVLVSFTFSEGPPSVATLALLNTHLSPEIIPQALDELRQHGLLAPSDDAFVYELHPVVREAADRSVTGAGLERAIDAYEKLGANRYYKTLEEAQQALDLFIVLARAGRLDAAYRLYRSRLDDLFNAEGAAGRCVGLLSRLCDEELAPLVHDVQTQIDILCDLSLALGQTGRFRDRIHVAERLQPLIQQARGVSQVLKARTRIISAACTSGRLALAASLAEEPVPDDAEISWLLTFQGVRARLKGWLGQVAEAKAIGRTVIERAGEIDWVVSRAAALGEICEVAWNMRDAELHAEIMPAYRAASQGGGRKFDRVLAELDEVRSRMLRPGALGPAEWSRIAIAAREIESRIAAMDVPGWVDDAALVGAMAEARESMASARRAAIELREIAERYERNGGVMLAAETRLDAAQIWALAGDVEAARADAVHARKLAYCDGPPYTAKLLEDRADALLAGL